MYTYFTNYKQFIIEVVVSYLFVLVKEKYQPFLDLLLYTTQMYAYDCVKG